MNSINIRTGWRVRLMLVAAATLAVPALAQAEKFKRAEVTKIVNDVRLLTGTKTSRPASRGSVVKGSTAVRTGQKSRTELQFPDESVVRLGSNSVFSFLQGKREVDLKQGTLLMQVPKSLGHTKVKTAAISAAITGTTILLEFIPEVSDEHGVVIRPARIKIIVVEGSLEFSLDIAPQKKLELFAGEMVAFSADAQELPQKFKIDLEQLVKTSLLMNGGMGQLPELQLMDDEVVAQNEEKRGGRLLGFDHLEPRKGRFLARLLPSRAISHARDVLNGRSVRARPLARPPRIVAPRNGNPSTGSPPVNPPVKIPLPERPDRPPPGVGPN